MSQPTSLVCPACWNRYEDRWRCECGKPLEFDVESEPEPRPDAATLDRERGLWAFDDLLPVRRAVTLGEGWTPLVDAPEWNASFKLEYVFPTGSFKDRGAATTLSRAAELGIDRVVEDSSGNAGAAIATYAARAGIDAEIYVPASAKESKLRAIERADADVVPVEGSRQAVTDACVEAVTDGDGWYASHAWNPAFLAGTATFAYEIAAQRGWKAPDAVVCPLGHGTLFLGAYRGFWALHKLGWIETLPRLLGVQAAGAAPIVEERHGADAAAGDNDVADGIQITEPVRKQEILSAIAETRGDAIAVDSEDVEQACETLHQNGFYVEPTSAAAPAGLQAYRKRGDLDADDDVVVPLTGSGLKS